MDEIAEWLEKLGMPGYARRFAENGIDFSVLRDLTDQDLKDLGIVLGDRRRLLRGIAGVAGTAYDTPQAEVSAQARLGGQAERRQVTVMFSDLVASTALSGRMDPEDVREIILAYRKCVAETVRRFGGFVARYIGDGVLVYFGYPQAHEDDAERAVRAGLELTAAVAGLKARTSLQTRVGIATGQVVVGDRGIVGETPNLAAHLQEIAEPNMVVIPEGTRRLLGNLFELEDLGVRDLKGVSVRAWAALQASAVESRFEALHATGLTALVGREEDAELLLRRWSKAKAGEGQVVLLSGEAGIGKSRLAAALLERVADEAHTRLRYFCSPQHSDSALYPIIGQMERAAGLARGDTPRTKLDKLDALLALTSTSTSDAALFAEMLSIPNDGRYPVLEPSPPQRRQKTLNALSVQMEALARSKPVLVIFEDVHWGDPTSLEALGRAMDRIATLQVLLIVTFRPEFASPWIGWPHITSLTINRLAPRHVETLINRIVGNKRLPAGIRQDIIERTDGIPLFVEEMTKAVLEAESESERRQTAAAVPSATSAVPASLHASLMARLDRLGTAKEVAQIGAAIGREFSRALLAAVIRKPEAELELALDRLVRAGLLFRQGESPHATYLFKHALVQDAAYGTLLRAPRRALHARIAETLEVKFPEMAERQPEVLARHNTEADLIEKAAGLWGKAGKRSLERSALVEAAEHLTRALGQMAVLPATPALRRKQIELQVALVAPLLHVKGHSAPETKAAAERARVLIEEAEALGEPPEDPLLLFSVLYGFWVASYVGFNGDAMCALAAQFLALAEKQGAKAPLMIGHRLVGVSSLFVGEPARASRHLDRAIAFYDPAGHRPLAMRFGQDIRVASLFYRSLARWLLGYPEAAVADADRAISEAREIGQAVTLIAALVFASVTHLHCRNYGIAKSQLDEAIALADKTGAMFWKSIGTTLKGCVSALIGKASEAAHTIAPGINAIRSAGASGWTPMYMAHLTRAQADLGRFDDAWRCSDDALTTARTSKERWYDAEIHRIAGEITLISLDPDAAKAEAFLSRHLRWRGSSTRSPGNCARR
jgi:class 3 adenylate cyclase/tetratricopeptide (TPR) repeat protein